MNFESFRNPPIKEAIFSVKFKEELPDGLLEEFCATEFILENYPTSKKSIVRQPHPVAQNQQETSIKDLQDGYLLDSDPKGEKLIQARKTHLSFHKLRTYIEWKSLIDEFKDICLELGKVSKTDINLEEISVRYINQISYEGDVREYFRLLPTEIEGLPSQFGNFFMQVAFPFEDLNGIITEAITHPNNSPRPVFIIDLKVIHSTTLSIKDPAIWDVFDRMREYKNRLFFSTITESIKPLFR